MNAHPVPRGERAFASEVRDALTRARSEGTLHALHFAAPIARPESMLGVLPGGTEIVWSPPKGPALGAVGVVRRIVADREGRFELSTTAETPRDVRWLGGFPFRPEARADAPWSGFGERGWFILPRWCYRREGEKARLTLVVDGAAVPIGAEELACEGAALMVALEADAGGPPQGIWDVPVHQLGPEQWHELVEAARTEIIEDRARKIVVARRAELTLPVAVDPRTVLRRLQDEHAGAHRFALVVEGTAFVGASPERLVRRQGRRVDADALAGTAAAPVGGSSTRQQEALRRSDKDCLEHQHVVDAVRAALEPLCAPLAISGAPTVRRAGPALHLHTPIRGLLREDVHLLEIAARLHPTPAIAGTPTPEALAWIDAHEATPRGWYAGAVGWFDRQGDGELVVAIRSALLRGRKAWIWAGGGIVEASDPDAEYEETRLKQQPMLRALGASG